MTPLVLGVDLGTTAVKVAVLDEEAGTSWPVATAPVPWGSRSTGAEIDAPVLFEVVRGALAEACRARPERQVAAVGIASFAESVVLLDRDGTALAPMVAWHDTRGGPQAEQLGRDVGVESFSSRTGLPVSALATTAKVRALADAGLDLSAVRTVLSATDWVAYRLGGGLGFDISLASRTGWLDLAERDWAEDLIAWTGLPRAALPPVRPPGTDRGVVGTDRGVLGAGPAGSPGLPVELAGALVVAAGMDHHVAAYGAGATAPGDVWDSCGTAEAFLRATDPLPPATVLDAVRRGLEVGWHADTDRQVVLGAQRSGYAFQRVLGLLGVTSAPELAALEQAGVPPTDDLPELNDVYLDSYTVVGLTSRTRREHVWAALVERVAADGAAVLREIDAVAGPHARVVTGGGWADSSWFAAAKRRHLSDVSATALPQPGAHGAALLARAALRSA